MVAEKNITISPSKAIDKGKGMPYNAPTFRKNRDHTGDADGGLENSVEGAHIKKKG